MVRPVALKKVSKDERRHHVLVGLVEQYIKTGLPIGSNTLQKESFSDISSATIRNYFAQLEEEGYLAQHHTSGGRIPTDKAFRHYAEQSLDQVGTYGLFRTTLAHHEALKDVQEVARCMQELAEVVSVELEAAVFFSAPRFDQDFVTEMKLVPLDHARCLSVLITSFGEVRTELLPVPRKLSMLSVKRMEAYFHARISGTRCEYAPLEPEEEQLAVRIYQESMARYLVTYANFTNDELFRTGFSQLLRYPEFHDAEALACSLQLFENETALLGLARVCMREQKLKFWIGDDLAPYLSQKPNSTCVAAPYRIGQRAVGVVGVIGPIRLPYPRVFSLLLGMADEVTTFLTRSLLTQKIAYRTPYPGPQVLEREKKIDLLEDHTTTNRKENIHEARRKTATR